MRLPYRCLRFVYRLRYAHAIRENKRRRILKRMHKSIWGGDPQEFFIALGLVDKYHKDLLDDYAYAQRIKWGPM